MVTTLKSTREQLVGCRAFTCNALCDEGHGSCMQDQVRSKAESERADITNHVCATDNTHAHTIERDVDTSFRLLAADGTRACLNRTGPNC